MGASGTLRGAARRLLSWACHACARLGNDQAMPRGAHLSLPLRMTSQILRLLLRPYLLSCIAIQACGCCAASMQVVWPSNTVWRPCMAVQAQAPRPRRALLFMSMKWAEAASGMSCHGCLMPCHVAAHALLAQVWTREAAGVRHAALSMMLQRARSAPAAGVRGRMVSSAAPAAGGGSGARRRRPARPPRGPSWKRGALCDASNARVPARLPARQR